MAAGSEGSVSGGPDDPVAGPPPGGIGVDPEPVAVGGGGISGALPPPLGFREECRDIRKGMGIWY